MFGQSDELDIALAKVHALLGLIGQVTCANGNRDHTQSEPALPWTRDDELVVRWADYSATLTGPDLRLRRFDINLNPLLVEGDAWECGIGSSGNGNRPNPYICDLSATAPVSLWVYIRGGHQASALIGAENQGFRTTLLR